MVLSVCLHVCGSVYRLFRMNNETYSDSIQHQQMNQEVYTKRNGIQQNICIQNDAMHCPPYSLTAAAAAGS